MTDNTFKMCIPFTNLYKLLKYEIKIERMFQEITEFVYGKKIFVNMLYPLKKYDHENEEIKLSKKILGL